MVTENEDYNSSLFSDLAMALVGCFMLVMISVMVKMDVDTLKKSFLKKRNSEILETLKRESMELMKETAKNIEKKNSLSDKKKQLDPATLSNLFELQEKQQELSSIAKRFYSEKQKAEKRLKSMQATIDEILTETTQNKNIAKTRLSRYINKSKIKATIKMKYLNGNTFSMGTAPYVHKFSLDQIKELFRGINIGDGIVVNITGDQTHRDEVQLLAQNSMASYFIYFNDELL
jgi:hypothetical protein